jgi:hypothetical protein
MQDRIKRLTQNEYEEIEWYEEPEDEDQNEDNEVSPTSEYSDHWMALMYSIGMSVTAFNVLEKSLTTAVSISMDPERRREVFNLIFIGHLPFSQKFELFKKYYGSSFSSIEDADELKSMYERLITKINTSNNIRNKFAHCDFSEMTKDYFFFHKPIVTANDGLNFEMYRISPSDLQADLDQFYETRIDLEKFTEMFWDKIWGRN